MRVVTSSDLPAFRQIAITLAQAEEALETVNRDGQFYTVVTESGAVHRKHPAFEALMAAKKQLSAELAQFGLTPAARQRVSVLAPESEGDPLDEFAVGRSDA
jgi:P27 family predicted phage terminase small subunit